MEIRVRPILGLVRPILGLQSTWNPRGPSEIPNPFPSLPLNLILYLEQRAWGVQLSAPERSNGAQWNSAVAQLNAWFSSSLRNKAE